MYNFSPKRASDSMQVEVFCTSSSTDFVMLFKRVKLSTILEQKFPDNYY